MAIRLILDDATGFSGESFGADVSVSGEVVFNTGMVGYPEALTDPSYRGQILVLTYPLVGNYGVPALRKRNGVVEHFESERIQVSGLVISDYSRQYSHHEATKSLGKWLREQGVPGIYGVDTRNLTKLLREKGVMLGKIMTRQDIRISDPNKRNLAAEVSIPSPVTYGSGRLRIVLVDCGVKHSIIRNFLQRGVTLIRVPWDYDFTKISCDGVFLSNGPGDPKMCKATIAHVQKAMQQKIPIFGICLGNQILGLAAGADTYKLKYGHRGQNQPCIQIGRKRCYITSQNHGYAVDARKLPRGWEAWFRNANDGTNEGIRHKTLPFMSVQWHPEANPGPTDTAFLFDEFISMVKQWQK